MLAFVKNINATDVYTKVVKGMPRKVIMALSLTYWLNSKKS